MLRRRRRIVAPSEVDATPSVTLGILDRVDTIIYFLAGLATLVLLVRFMLVLFGADMATGFGRFTSYITTPLMAPFRDLFGGAPPVTTGTFEYYDLIAMVVYWIGAAILVRILDLLFVPPARISYQ